MLRIGQKEVKEEERNRGKKNDLNEDKKKFFTKALRENIWLCCCYVSSLEQAKKSSCFAASEDGKHQEGW